MSSSVERREDGPTKSHPHPPPVVLGNGNGIPAPPPPLTASARHSSSSYSSSYGDRRIRLNANKEHVPDKYDDLLKSSSADEFDPSIFSSLERHLPPTMLGNPRNTKLNFMKDILRKYLPQGERVRAHRHKEYKQRILLAYQFLQAIGLHFDYPRGSTMHASDKNKINFLDIANYVRASEARKALCALKGLVKLQALVRGHLVRRHTIETLQHMQALVTTQARARTQKNHTVEEAQSNSRRQPNQRTSQQNPRFRQSYEAERNAEEH